jgi:hypothetical protein
MGNCFKKPVAFPEFGFEFAQDHLRFKEAGYTQFEIERATLDELRHIFTNQFSPLYVYHMQSAFKDNEELTRLILKKHSPSMKILSPDILLTLPDEVRAAVVRDPFSFAHVPVDFKKDPAFIATLIDQLKAELESEKAQVELASQNTQGLTIKNDTDITLVLELAGKRENRRARCDAITALVRQIS